MTAKKRHATKLIEQVASNIKYYRTKKRMSQEKLQEETGLAIFRYESGRQDMTLTTIDVLARHLDIDPYELLKWFY